MTDGPYRIPPSEPDPNASPFAVHAIEGLPFDRGSEEDLAIKRILRWGEEDAEPARPRKPAGRARSGRARTAEKLVDLVPRLLRPGRRGRR